ncbi:unnamed protein product [Brachionus calyciflorus]|uniref:Uncharacterized protein n=1 Tax=Brachionus calyciflorus TaxID=104777 RepID=A0A814BHK1_9BILA|nr:unnamed protein product [Brachionus calyciflorus]
MRRTEDYLEERRLNNMKKKILKRIEQENQRIEQSSLRDKSQTISRQIRFTTRSEIINYHDEMVNKLDIIFETELSGLTNIKYKEKIEKLNLDRNLILEEMQKVKNENLSEENVGKRFKYCFLIDKKIGKTAILVIANFDHDFVSFEKKFLTPTERSFEDAIKSIILLNLMDSKLIIDLTNPEKNEVNQISSFRAKNVVHPDFIDQYINIEKIKIAKFQMNELSKIPKELFKNLRYIIKLYISDYFYYIAANDFSFLENLVSLNFSNGVQEIRPNAFNGLNNLVYLNLNYCSLSYLEEGCFDGLVNLKFLNLQSNILREISESVFEPLKKLIYLDLSLNRIRNEVNLNGLESLRHLHINSSKLFKLEFNSSNDLLSIEGLNFYTIFTTHRIDTESLKYLCLSQFPTELSSNQNAFKSLEYLKIDSLCTDNQFLDQFNFENLKVLIGKFEKIPKFGKNLRNLKYLKISDVKEFDKCCFEYLNSLDYLDISLIYKASLINNIEEDHFKGVNNLKFFWIKSNFAEPNDFLTKEPIFENVIKSNGELEFRKSDRSFWSFVPNYKSDPLENVNVSDELRKSLQNWFWKF